LPAEKIVNFVRACDYFPFRSPWGHPQTRLGGQELEIVKASRTGLPCDVQPGTVGPRADSAALIAAADEWILVKKIALGDRYVNAGDLFKSGDRLADVTSFTTRDNATHLKPETNMAADPRTVGKFAVSAGRSSGP
jgi:hypothetical protein